jgi:hypothetical protein
MIIGISGKIGSGKDTIGKIIQYLIFNSSVISINHWLQHDQIYHSHQSGWKIKKFADSLKDIVCLLIGCTREQLEDREFKEKELGEEWWYQEYIHKFSGKYVKIPYGNKIPEDVYNDDSKGAFIKLTPRLFMQLIGTEVAKEIHPSVWVNNLMKDYKQIGMMADEIKGIYKLYPNWIITDLRFPNELKAIKDRGGISIRVNRHNHPNDINPNTEHPSETALDDAEFDYTIINNGTIEDLIEKVKVVLKHSKII